MAGAFMAPAVLSVYQLEREGQGFPQVPVFATAAEDRAHRTRAQCGL
jgi:hypothetical protein